LVVSRFFNFVVYTMDGKLALGGVGKGGDAVNLGELRVELREVPLSVHVEVVQESLSVELLLVTQLLLHLPSDFVVVQLQLSHPVLSLAPMLPHLF